MRDNSSPSHRHGSRRERDESIGEIGHICFLLTAVFVKINEISQKIRAKSRMHGRHDTFSSSIYANRPSFNQPPAHKCRHTAKRILRKFKWSWWFFVVVVAPYKTSFRHFRSDPFTLSLCRREALYANAGSKMDASTQDVWFAPNFRISVVENVCRNIGWMFRMKYWWATICWTWTAHSRRSLFRNNLYVSN